VTSPASGAGSAAGPPGYAPIPQSAPGTQSVTGRSATPGATAGGGNRRLGLALLVIATAQLMVVLDGTIVNVALPHIQLALGFSGTGAQADDGATAPQTPRGLSRAFAVAASAPAALRTQTAWDRTTPAVRLARV
jgi:hypothetical protein